MAAQRQDDEAREETTPERREETTPERSGRGAAGHGESLGSELRRTVRGELTSVVREAAIDVLTPVAHKATSSLAKYAVTKGPELVKDVVAPKLQGAGGPAALAKAAASKAGGAGQLLSKAGGAGQLLSKARGRGGGDGKGGAAASGTGRGRRLPVQEYIDVAVPVETAYDQWTQFEDFPRFMRGVEQVEQRDDTTLVWHERLWGVRRSWVAEITDQRPGERIAWRSTGGPQHVGVVTFHKLSDRLTRVQVNLDHEPRGVFEKAASGMRYTRRAVKADLKRFKAFVEMGDEATGAWRGRVEEGEVVEEKSGRGRKDRDGEAPNRNGERRGRSSRQGGNGRAPKAQARRSQGGSAKSSSARSSSATSGSAKSGSAKSSSAKSSSAKSGEKKPARASSRRS